MEKVYTLLRKYSSETRKAESNDPAFSLLQLNMDLFFEWGRRENHPPILIYWYLNDIDIFGT